MPNEEIKPPEIIQCEVGKEYKVEECKCPPYTLVSPIYNEEKQEWFQVCNPVSIEFIPQPPEVEANAQEWADYLGLTLEEFTIVSTSVREYLYQEYGFLRETKFGISYTRVDIKIEDVPTEAIVIKAYPTFRTPPPIITVALHQGKADIISEEIPQNGS